MAHCTCSEIREKDPLRHFKGCALRRPLPPGHPEAEKHYGQVAIENLLRELTESVRLRGQALIKRSGLDLECENEKIETQAQAILALLKVAPIFSLLVFFLVGCGDAFDSSHDDFTKLQPDGSTSLPDDAGEGSDHAVGTGGGTADSGLGGSGGVSGGSGGLPSVGGSSGAAGSAGAPTGGTGGSGGALADAGSVCKPAVNDPGTLCPSGKQTWVCGGYMPPNCESSGLGCCVCCDGIPIE